MYSKERFLKSLQIPPPEITVVNACVSVFPRLHNIPFYVCAVLCFNQSPIDGIALCKVFSILCLYPFSLVIFPPQVAPELQLLNLLHLVTFLKFSGIIPDYIPFTTT